MRPLTVQWPLCLWLTGLVGMHPMYLSSVQVWSFTSTAAFPSVWCHRGLVEGSMCAHMERCPVLVATQKTYQGLTPVQLPVAAP